MSLGFNVSTRSKKSRDHHNWLDAKEKYGGRVAVTLYIPLPIIIFCLFDGTSPSRLFWGIALIVAIGYIAFNLIQMSRIVKCPGCDVDSGALLDGGRVTDGKCLDCGADLMAPLVGPRYVSPNYLDK